jgi:hypothetical protein
MVHMADPDNKDGLNIEDFINMMRNLKLLPENEKHQSDVVINPLHDLKKKHTI